MLNAVTAAVLGVGLFIVTAWSPVVTRSASGPPGYDFEVWIANALLSVTFPFLIFLAAYFAYWPLKKAE